MPVERGRARVSSIRVSRSVSSKRQSSTRSAFSEKSEKFVPSPSQVAPSGNGCPGQTSISGESSTRRLPKSATSSTSPRRSAQHLRVLVGLGLELARQLAAQREQLAVERDPARRGWSFERTNVSSACGSGTSSPEKRGEAPRTRARRPSRVASAIAGSMWSVKNWNGAGSPYSSPMKSSGVHGEKSARRRRRAARPAAGGRRARGCRPGRGSARRHEPARIVAGACEIARASVARPSRRRVVARPARR